MKTIYLDKEEESLLPSKPKNKKNILRAIKSNIFLYLLILPGVAYFIVFKIIPMWGILISFMDYSPYTGFFNSKWIGFQNYKELFTNKDFLIIFRNTMAISLLNLIFYFPVPIILALMLNEVSNTFFKKTVQSIIYLPHFLSWVIVTGLTFGLLSQSNGIINNILSALGFEKCNFLINPKLFWSILTSQSIWKEAGWGTVIYLAALAGVDVEQYESAKIDGASALKQVWHITLPGIRNVIITLLILRIGNIMDVGFEQVFLMQNSAVSQVSDVFETYVYRVGVQNGRFSYSTAVGLFKSIIGFVLVISANTIAKKFGEEGVY
jgi:putative aldouronate transport system permease protein